MLVTELYTFNLICENLLAALYGVALKTYYYHLRKLRKEICEQIPVPVMTVPEGSHSVKISIGEVTAEIPEGISEQMMTTLIRAMRNA